MKAFDLYFIVDFITFFLFISNEIIKKGTKQNKN